MAFAQLTNDICNESTSNFLGSICCLVQSTLNPSIQGLVTSGHVFTNGAFINFDGFVSSDQAFTALSNGNSIGELYFQQMSANQDLAVIQLTTPNTVASTIKNFPLGYYPVSTSDLNSSEANVTILSKNNNQRDAFIVGINVSVNINYGSISKIMRNVILIGSSPDQSQSTTVSTSGDSGSCVYHKSSEKLIGMLLGGDDKYSFVLPIDQTLTENNFKLV